MGSPSILTTVHGMAELAAPEEPDNNRTARAQLPNIDDTLYDKTKALVDLTLLTSSIHSIVEAWREQKIDSAVEKNMRLAVITTFGVSVSFHIILWVILIIFHELGTHLWTEDADIQKRRK